MKDILEMDLSASLIVYLRKELTIASLIRLSMETVALMQFALHFTPASVAHVRLDTRATDMLASISMSAVSHRQLPSLAATSLFAPTRFLDSVVNAPKDMKVMVTIVL
jgi:hypothetical protein